MFDVVCYRWDGKFDHLFGFSDEADARGYVQSQSGSGCRYEIWSAGVRVL